MDVFMPTYTGTNRSETIIASDGSDSIYGLDGNDRLITLDGSDFADAGNGDDEINAVFSAADSGFLVYPNRGSKRLLGGNGNDTIHGSKDPDTILGEMGNDHLAGDTADDSIYGGEGDDTINGNSGADTLRGGANNDQLDGSDGSDSLDGGAGNDKLLDQATGDDTLLGGDGDDHLDTFTGTGNKQLDGGNGNDSLYGGRGNDTLQGNLGNDFLLGYEGSDYLDGGSGTDSLSGGAGSDLIYGGEGDDRVNYLDDSGDDTVYGGDGNDLINYNSSTGIKTLFGDAGEDSVYGGKSADSLSGGLGNDDIAGNEGNDKLNGGDGDDALLGGGGDDQLFGGKGSDTAIFSGEFSGYTVTRLYNSEGERTGYRVAGPDGNDTISTDVEFLAFSDRRMRPEEGLPVIQFAAKSGQANEGSSGSTTVSFQATLSAASTQAVTVPITYSGTATQGTDYSNAATNITIAAGQTTGNATFSVVGDTTVESNETVILMLGTPTNATLGTNATFTHTILNDDVVIPTVQFTAASSSSNEGNSGGTTVTVQATLSAASTQTVTVPISYAGTASSGTDYTNAFSTITIAAGQTTGSVTFLVVGDTIVESNETVILNMGTPTNATPSTTTIYTHTIVNDDPQGDDIGSTASTAGRVSAGSSVNGNIEVAADRDWFAINLTAGQAYTFRLNAAAASGLTDPYLTLYNASGTQLAADDDSGGNANALLTYTPSTSATYYLEARGYGSAVGPYTLAATEVAQNPQASGNFSITVNYTGDPRYQPYFTAAANRWAEIIVGDLPDVRTASALIDDLAINASVTAIDGVGGVLGRAGPTAFRSMSQGGLPYSGTMQFDTADIANLLTAGTLGDVVLHEMAHVMGFSGSVFQRFGLVAPSNVYAYTGTYALQAYASLTSAAPTNVPLETSGGQGTAASHWSETVFDKELMTGFAENTPPMPISIVTVGALRDLGYEVDYTKADSFRF